jgi:hypothetical protein
MILSCHDSVFACFSVWLKSRHGRLNPSKNGKKCEQKGKIRVGSLVVKAQNDPGTKALPAPGL